MFPHLPCFTRGREACAYAFFHGPSVLQFCPCEVTVTGLVQTTAKDGVLKDIFVLVWLDPSTFMIDPENGIKAGPHRGRLLQESVHLKNESFGCRGRVDLEDHSFNDVERTTHFNNAMFGLPSGQVDLQFFNHLLAESGSDLS